MLLGVVFELKRCWNDCLWSEREEGRKVLGVMGGLGGGG
jgi:hypothetical protein